MNENITRALTVYVPPKKQNIRYIVDTGKKLMSSVRVAFSKRRIELISFFAIFILSFFLSVCICNYDYNVQCLLFHCFEKYSATNIVVISLVVIAFSGFTIFGKVIPVLFDILSAFAVGSYVNYLFFNFENGDHFFALIFMFFIVVLSFLLLVFNIEVFKFSNNAIIGKRALFSIKPLLSYLTFTLIIISLITLIFKLL